MIEIEKDEKLEVEDALAGSSLQKKITVSLIN